MNKRDSGRTLIADRDSALLRYMYENMQGQSRSAVKAYLTRGQVTVNGQSTTAFDYPVHKGDRIMIHDKGIMVKKRGGEKDTRVKIVFEDDWLIVVDKRSGVLSMSTGRPGETTAYSLLSDYVKRVYGKDGTAAYWRGNTVPSSKDARPKTRVQCTAGFRRTRRA